MPGLHYSSQYYQHAMTLQLEAACTIAATHACPSGNPSCRCPQERPTPPPPRPPATRGGGFTLSGREQRPIGEQGAAAGSGWWGIATTSAAHS